jgi:23S rRNA (cytidine1920-2'-O)/16S rRNA (cytidine1409-2'-O)-methyltransferase
MKKSKKRLDELLVDRGMAATLSLSRALVMAGQVVVEGVPIVKSGMLLPSDIPLRLKEKNPYVSRGGLKLEGAMKALPITVTGKICMDIGASTGGFTDCLLQHGAARVYAVDVGEGLLDSRLRSDARVVNIENANFRYFSCESLKEPVQFATIDVSFISLEKILPAVLPCLTVDGEILALVKPQFEVLPSATVRGVVKDETTRSGAIEKMKRFAADRGLLLKGETDSPLKGPQGNVEHFLWLLKRQ